jgi:hypothetical protein
MNALRNPLHRTALTAVFVLGTLALAGCAEKVTNVDAGFTTPEGQYDANARLVLYPDVPITVESFVDLAPDGPDAADPLSGTEQRYIAPGAIHGVILDGTTASGYQVLRREADGGYGQLKDYTLNPIARFFDTHWEMYAFSDGAPSSFSPPTYVGRGLVSGAVTPRSPLTNVARVPGTSVANIVYTATPWPADSNITMTWQAVPGAAGYWIQIYQFMGGSLEKLLSAQPAPFVISDARNYFIGYVPAPATSYKLNQPGALVLFQRGLILMSEYMVRITAVDDQSQLIAMTYGDYGYVRSVGSYLRYRLGAVLVIPGGSPV